jgi:hypothetical protein
MFGSSILYPLPTQIFHSSNFLNLISTHQQQHFKLKQKKLLKVKNNRLIVLSSSSSSDTSYEVGGGFPLEELLNRNEGESSSNTDTSAQREALLKGGDQVISVLQEMITLVSCFFRFLNFEFENLKLSV